MRQNIAREAPCKSDARGTLHALFRLYSGLIQALNRPCSDILQALFRPSVQSLHTQVIIHALCGLYPDPVQALYSVPIQTLFRLSIQSLFRPSISVPIRALCRPYSGPFRFYVGPYQALSKPYSVVNTTKYQVCLACIMTLAGVTNSASSSLGKPITA